MRYYWEALFSAEYFPMFKQWIDNLRDGETK